MLLELINHYHDLPFAMDFSNVAEEAPHYHLEAEIVLALRGSARYKVHHQEFFINTGDMLIIDTQDIHHICESSDDVLLLTSYIDMAHFDDIYPDIDFMIFACEQLGTGLSASHQRAQNKIAFITHQLADMMMIQNKGASDKLLEEKLLDIINMMVNHLQGFFVEKNQFTYGADSSSQLNLDRLAHIINYLYANYDKNVTLSDIAELEHLSVHYVSHLIKETSGLSFQKLINYIRVEYSEKLLNDADMNLTQISEACGFSSPTYFNKCFSEWHHMTPSQYRKQKRPSSRTFHGEIDRDEAMALLLPYAKNHLGEEAFAESTGPYRHAFIHLDKKQLDTKQSAGSHTLCDIFPLHIFIDSEDELKKLIYYKVEVLKLMPASLTASDAALASPLADHIRYSLAESGLHIHEQKSSIICSRKEPAINAADACEKIFASPRLPIRLFGDTSALFTEQGFPTAYYSAYKAFASLGGSIAYKKDRYAVSADSDLSSVVLYNAEPDILMKAHLVFNDGRIPQQIATRTFSGNSSMYSLANEVSFSASFDYRLKKYLFDFASGSVDFIFPEPSNEGRWDIDIPASTMMVLTFTQK